MNIFIIIICCYFVGTIPFSYIITKYSTGLNITKLGTYNMGAMNSYEITHNIFVGISVTILDMLKGFIAVYFSHKYFTNFESILLSSIFVIIGHNYNVFFKFKGGRGLAAGVGVFLIINPSIVCIWIIIWLLCYYFFLKNVHVANTLALFYSLVIIIIINYFYNLPFNFLELNNFELLIIVIIIYFIVFLKHIKPLIKFYKETSNNKS